MEENKSKFKRKIKDFLRIHKKFLILIVTFAIAFIIFFIINNRERYDITSITVEHQLSPIGELATYKYTYTDYDINKNSRIVLGLDVPGTQQSLIVIYSGIIKVGYDVEGMEIQVDNENKRISVTLPEPKVLDNYIDEQAIKYLEERNNIFNPIKTDNIIGNFESYKEKQLEYAKENGLFELAKENATEIISLFLKSLNDGYEIDIK